MSISPMTGSMYHDALHHVTEVVSQHPTAMTAAIVGSSAAIGAFFEYRESSKVADNREQLVEEWNVLTEGLAPTRKQRVGRAIASIACVGGSILGYMNAQTFINDGSAEVVPPTVQLVIDKSGSSLLDDQKAAQSVARTAKSFNDNLKHFDTTAWVASAGTVDQLSLEEATNLRPFGDAPLSRAFGLSIDTAAQNRADLVAGQEVPSTAIAVITNGNRIGATVSDKEIENAGSPVFIFDVSDTSTAATELKDIAMHSGGEYYSHDSFDTTDEMQQKLAVIADRVNETKKDGETTTDWNSRLVTLGLSVLGMTIWKLRRPKEPTLFNIPHEQSRSRKFLRTVTDRMTPIAKKVRR